VARISAPSAQDAQGTVVPVQMSVLRNSLVLSVPHRSHDFDYPILVDPEITINILESSEGWVFGQTISGPYGPVFTPGPFVPGSPGSLTLPSTEFSYGEGEDTVEGGLAHWDAWPRPSADISSVEFVGISTSYSYSSHEYEESGESVNVSACKEVRSAGPFRTGEETLPSKVRFVPLLHDPGSCKEEDISVEMGANGPVEHELWLKEEGKREPGEEPVLIHKVFMGGGISVSAILVSEPESKEELEEEEKTEEQYGTNNPGQPDRHYCLLGKPVDCATGNEVETQTDLSLGGRSNLNLTRTYNSKLAAIQSEHGPFGWGWTASYGAHLRRENRCHGTNCWSGPGLKDI
jgi:hypothetical protein